MDTFFAWLATAAANESGSSDAAQSFALRNWHEPVIHYVLLFVERFPMIWTLILLIFLDIIGGFTIAFMAKQANSSASFRGMCKKAYMMLIVGMCKALEPYTYGMPLANVVAMYFIAVEGLSILENAALLGVPLPPGLVERLTKMRDTTKNQLFQERINPTPIVEVKTVIQPNNETQVDVVPAVTVDVKHNTISQRVELPPTPPNDPSNPS